MDDDKIIEMFFNRDEQALVQTKEKYEKLVLSVSNNLLGSMQDAEECLSDTLIQLWNTIPPIHPDSLKSYAAKIARNLAINRLKYISADKRGSGNYSAVLDDLRDIIPSGENIEMHTDASELKELINRFLGTISKENRIIFVKRYWLFASVEEISKELKISKTKITTSLHRTRKKLKDYLIKEGYYI